MGSTVKRPKGRGHDAATDPLRTHLLACGCSTDAQPTISSPVAKWFCCGEYQREKAKR
jgi:hypothetical protein